MTGLLERFAGMSVLVIDDDVGSVEFLKQLLVHQGIDRVYVETDARRVPQKLIKHHPDLVVLDLHMPHVAGFTVLDQVRTFASGDYLPVLMLTGDVATETRNRALMSGAQDFLTKPIDAVEALLRIANLLQTRELYSNLRRSMSAGRDHRFSTAEDRADLLIRIRDILDRGSVVSVFQPIMDLKSLATAGHESLSRFPGSALRGPDKWFSDAFAVDLGVELEWMAAMSALRYFDTAPPDLFLTINMSPATVLHLAEEDLCIESRCPRIVIELTEHAPVEDYGPLHRALDSIRGRGARLSADDLGSGYAGFRHLFRLKPDVIKLDISLVGGIHRHRGQQALTRAILAFALEMGAQVVAEGIEQLADLRVLQDLGIPFGQGYLLGRPAAVPLCAKVPSEESVVPRPPLRKPRTPPRERANSNSAQLRVQ